MTSRHHRRAQLRAAFAAFLVSATLPSIAHGQEMMAEQFIGKFTVFGVEGLAALRSEEHTSELQSH